VQPARLEDPLAGFSRKYQTSREPLCRAVTRMPRFSSRMTVGVRGTHTPRLVAAGSHDPLWDARGVQPVHIRCPYLPGEDGSNVLSGHAMQGRWTSAGRRPRAAAARAAERPASPGEWGPLASTAPSEQAHPVVRKDPAHCQRTFSFLPGSPATVEPDQTGRSTLDALCLLITGLRHVLARLEWPRPPSGPSWPG
jgi:hypothetical protein